MRISRFADNGNIGRLTITQRYSLAVASGIGLAISYPDFNYSFFAWIAFVPLLIAIEQQNPRESYLLGLVCGVVGISIGFSWIESWARLALEVPFPLSVFYIFFYAFSFGQVFGIASLVFCWLSNRKVFPEIILFPVVFVFFFSLFPSIFRFTLGDSQTQFLVAIQPIEYTGVYGLDSILLLANIVFYQLLTFKAVGRQKLWLFLSVAILVGWLWVGYLSLASWNKQMKEWSTVKIGIVQPNRAVTLSRPEPLPGYSRTFPLELEMSQMLALHDAEVIIWPEGHFYGYTFWNEVKAAFEKAVKSMGVHLIFYDVTYQINHENRHHYNSILHLNPKGNLLDVYHKIKLVPFSETLPLVEESGLFNWILGDYLDNLSAGNEQKVFNVNRMRLVPKTCYEPLFPEFVAETIGQDGKGKVILTQSQDGWFGETSQPNQHIAVTVLRAVENRVPLIHVINNGPSSVIRPDGGFVHQGNAFVREASIVEMPFNPNSGGSFYSRFPKLFVRTLQLLMVLIVSISLLFKPLRSKFATSTVR